MSKPMPKRRKKPVPPSSSAVVKKTEKRDTYAVHVDGKIKHYDVKTGELIDTKAIVRKTMEAYNPEKVDALLHGLSKALPFRTALTEAGISYSSYLMWRKHNPDLEANIKKAKSIRAEAMAEEMFEHDMAPLMAKKVGTMDMTDASIYEKRLKILKAKQGAFKGFRSIEGEYVEMDRGSNVNVAAAVKIEIPEKVVKLVETNFRPTMKGEKVVLPSPSEDIIELETQLREE